MTSFGDIDIFRLTVTDYSAVRSFRFTRRADGQTLTFVFEQVSATDTSHTLGGSSTHSLPGTAGANDTFATGPFYVGDVYKLTVSTNDPNPQPCTIETIR